jgi:hypothetical protein
MRRFIVANINQIWQKVHQFKFKFGVLIVGEIDQEMFCAPATFNLAKKVW